MCAGRRGVVAAKERTELAVVVFLVLDDVLEDGDRAFVAEGLELLAVAGDVAAFFDLKAAQGHAHAAGAVGQRIGLAAGATGVDGLRSAELLDAALPQRGVLDFSLGQMAQHLRAHRIGVAVGEGVVGVVALHLGLPVAFKGGKDLLVSGAAQNGDGHGVNLASKKRITDRAAPRRRNDPMSASGGLSQPVAVSRIVLCGLGKAAPGMTEQPPDLVEPRSTGKRESLFMAENTKTSAPLTSPGYFMPFVTVTALFLTFGFITTLNMSLVPHLRSIFNVGYKSAMLAESAFFLAYFVFSAPTSKLIEWMGYKKTMVMSLFIQVVGCLLFIPAANLVNFPLFLTACFVVGAGVTALQTSVNPYAAILGPEASAPVRLTLAQAFNSIGTTVAPIFAGAFILTDPTKFATPAAIADTVRTPYIVIAGALLVLGIAVAFSRLPHIDQPPSSHAQGGTCRRAAAFGATGTRCWARWAFSFMWAWKLDWRRSR